MKSRTPQTVESIDERIGELRALISDLEDDLKWQPHMKHIVDELKSSVLKIERDFGRQFLRALERGWFY